MAIIHNSIILNYRRNKYRLTLYCLRNINYKHMRYYKPFINICCIVSSQWLAVQSLLSSTVDTSLSTNNLLVCSVCSSNEHEGQYKNFQNKIENYKQSIGNIDINDLIQFTDDISEFYYKVKDNTVGTVDASFIEKLQELIQQFKDDVLFLYIFDGTYKQELHKHAKSKLKGIASSLKEKLNKQSLNQVRQSLAGVAVGLYMVRAYNYDKQVEIEQDIKKLETELQKFQTPPPIPTISKKSDNLTSNNTTKTIRDDSNYNSSAIDLTKYQPNTQYNSTQCSGNSVTPSTVQQYKNNQPTHDVHKYLRNPQSISTNDKQKIISAGNSSQKVQSDTQSQRSVSQNGNQQVVEHQNPVAYLEGMSSNIVFYDGTCDHGIILKIKEAGAYANSCLLLSIMQTEGGLGLPNDFNKNLTKYKRFKNKSVRDWFAQHQTDNQYCIYALYLRDQLITMLNDKDTRNYLTRCNNRYGFTLVNMLFDHTIKFGSNGKPISHLIYNYDQMIKDLEPGTALGVEHIVVLLYYLNKRYNKNYNVIVCQKNCDVKGFNVLPSKEDVVFLFGNNFNGIEFNITYDKTFVIYHNGGGHFQAYERAKN